MDGFVDMSDSTLLWVKNPGLEGIGRLIELLLNMWMTKAMVGLSAIFSWTHNSPMLIHRSVSVVELSLNVGSTIFETVLSLQFFHTYKIIKIHIQFQSGNFFCITSVTNIGKRERYTVLTQLRRSSIFSPLQK